MKTLHLMRHAKSDWGSPGLPDRERSLNPRGQRDAPLMGTALSEIVQAMRVHVSPARRARMTLEGLCDAWPAMDGMDHIVDENLYTFASNDLVDWLESRPSELETIFIIGHNPALTELTNRLTKEYTVDNLPTAGYVQLSLEIDHWDQLLHCVASLEHSLLPKQLK